MPAKLSENPDYGFCVGRVRFLESRLLNGSDYDRLVRAEGEKGMTAALCETRYGCFVGQDQGLADVDAMLDQADSVNVAFLRECCLDPWLLTFMELRFDVHNLKVLMKRRLSGDTGEQASFSKTGALSADDLAGVFTGNVEGRAQWAVTVWREVEGSYGADRDPSVVDTILDRALQRQQMSAARRSAFLRGYLAVHADAENIRTFFRARLLGEGQGLFNAAFLPGGEVGKEELDLYVKGDSSEVARHFAPTAFRAYIDEGISGLNRGSLLRMEKLGREMELAYLRGARHAVFGHEPVVAFHLLWENEIRNVRGLCAGKRAGLAEADLRDFIAYAS